MGFIDFVKKAGEKKSVFDKVKENDYKAKADIILARVAELGFNAEGLTILIDGDVATVTGEAASRADRERIVLAVGNQVGIARVDDQLTVASSRYHTVERGDSLSKIAKEVYGNAMKYPVIFEANKPMLTDPDKIYPGQVLRIPPLED